MQIYFFSEPINTCIYVLGIGNGMQQGHDTNLKQLWNISIYSCFVLCLSWYRVDRVWNNFDNPSLSSYPLGAAPPPPRDMLDSFVFPFFVKRYQWHTMWNSLKHFEMYRMCFKLGSDPSCMSLPQPRKYITRKAIVVFSVFFIASFRSNMCQHVCKTNWKHSFELICSRKNYMFALTVDRQMQHYRLQLTRGLFWYRHHPKIHEMVSDRSSQAENWMGQKNANMYLFNENQSLRSYMGHANIGKDNLSDMI